MWISLEINRYCYNFSLTHLHKHTLCPFSISLWTLRFLKSPLPTIPIRRRIYRKSLQINFFFIKNPNFVFLPVLFLWDPNTTPYRFFFFDRQQCQPPVRFRFPVTAARTGSTIRRTGDNSSSSSDNKSSRSDNKSSSSNKERSSIGEGRRRFRGIVVRLRPWLRRRRLCRSRIVRFRIRVWVVVVRDRRILIGSWSTLLRWSLPSISLR